MTVTAVTHGEKRRRSERYSLPPQDLRLLELPEAQPIIARLFANTDETYPLRTEHVMRIAALCVKARLKPMTPYAKPTLFLEDNASDSPGDATIWDQRVARAEGGI